MPIIIDAHQDLAYNMINFNRDYLLSAKEIRQKEAGTYIPTVNGDTLLGWSDYQKGSVALVFATIFAFPENNRLEPWEKNAYRTPSGARDIYRQQYDTYQRLTSENHDYFQFIKTQSQLERLTSTWLETAASPSQNKPPVGILLLIEGAEGIQDPEDLWEWWELGVRIIGPAWGANRFCGGTGAPGPISKEGWALLDAMADVGIALDLSHMSEISALQALDDFPGDILASHSNAKALLKDEENERHLTDLQIQRIIDREGIIGVIPYNRFLVPGGSASKGKETVQLKQLVNHIDHICQIAGNARNVGFGTDFDGGFGQQQTPVEIDTIADLQKMDMLLSTMGYTLEDIEMIFWKNWNALLQRILPAQ